MDLMAARFNNPGHPYPEMCVAGLGHLWVGPKRNDFAEPLIQAAQKHLKKHNLPCERGDGINYIRNLVRRSDWGALEQRDEEGQQLAAPVVATAVDSTFQQPVQPKAADEMSPEELAARKAAIALARQKLTQNQEGI